jgi:hypothetical protein
LATTGSDDVHWLVVCFFYTHAGLLLGDRKI